MSRQWTDNQKKAIAARGEQILVSAAAGSGKTAVLTERVKNILCDTENTCSVSEILVVTFTRAAAGEMRDRISSALREELKKNKAGNAYLKKQLALLPAADICTIDAFCAKIVKENSHLTDISSDFKILDDNDNKVLMSQTASETVSLLYEENDDAFKMLRKLFLSERDDISLEEIIIALYNYSHSYPLPDEWLGAICRYFDEECKITDTPWSKVMFDYISIRCAYCLNSLKTAVKLMREDGEFQEDYIAAFETTKSNFTEILNCCKNSDWDGAVAVINGAPVVKYRLNARKADENVKDYAKYAIGLCESFIKDLWKCTLPTSEEHKNDLKFLSPVVKKLAESVQLFASALYEKKKEQNEYSFDDILHKCIELCVQKDGDVLIKTPLASELSQKYKEILIDEYQDTNEAQNIIFEAVSRDSENFYCVGDVKQSIYSFRLASPELFMKLRLSLPDYDGTKKASQITLEKNFRSRQGVTDAVNYAFSRLMTRKIGDIDYDEREYLYCGAKYEDNLFSPETELHCIEAFSLNRAELLQNEAKITAEYIENQVKLHTPVLRDDGTYTGACYGDFCILLRSTKNRADFYIDALKERGIPFTYGADGVVGDSKETALLISLIKAIDNPAVDIPFIAVMMSPIFGFTPDEIAKIRMVDKNADMYTCALKFAETDEKTADFINKLSLYRNVSAAYPIYDFVKFIVDDTGLADIYLAAENGAERTANIKGFMALADSFTGSGRCSLSSFVRYIDSVQSSGGIKRKSSEFSSGGSVKIMTIHKSKGLEFPYVIIADCSSEFNKSDIKGALTVSRSTGVGLKIRDDDKFTRYHSLSSAATEKAILMSGASEELRVLYVAMTRAKEHLVFMCSLASKASLERIKYSAINGEKSGFPLNSYTVLSALCTSEWICSAFALHPDCGELRELAGIKTAEFSAADFGIKFTNHMHLDTNEAEAAETEAEITVSPDSELMAQIKERTDYVYPYENLSGVLAKRTASSAESNAGKSSFFASAKPKFIAGALTGADRGTAVHKFLELCDFCEASRSIEAEKSRLGSAGLMTSEELGVVSEDDISVFFISAIGKRLLSADKVLKEYEFSVLRDAGTLYPELDGENAEEQIFVQGKLDCAFFEGDNAVLIDYKTDNTTDEKSLISAYRGQLEIYKGALEECTGKTVSEVYIYSLKMRKFIRV